MPKPSDEFWFAFCNAGSLAITCEQCGRLHFCTYDGAADYEDGELEEYRAKAEAEPDRYLECSAYSSIQWGYIGGKQTVWGCPCNEKKVYPYEQFILAHADAIMDFLQARAKAKLTEAERMMAKVNETVEATETK